MTKNFFIAIFVSLFFSSYANAWDMNEYIKNAYVDKQIEKTDSKRQAFETQISKKDSLKHHSVSITYGLITITDLAAVSAAVATSIFSLGNSELSESMFGALSIDYGYKFNESIETGFVFNYAHPWESTSFYTFMPKIKLNLNYSGFVNPFVELDAGILTDFETGIAPMFHITFLGLEIGRTIPIIFNILSFGQRGIASAGIGIRF